MKVRLVGGPADGKEPDIEPGSWIEDEPNEPLALTIYVKGQGPLNRYVRTKRDADGVWQYRFIGSSVPALAAPLRR